MFELPVSRNKERKRGYMTAASNLGTMLNNSIGLCNLLVGVHLKNRNRRVQIDLLKEPIKINTKHDAHVLAPALVAHVHNRVVVFENEQVCSFAGMWRDKWYEINGCEDFFAAVSTLLDRGFDV